MYISGTNDWPKNKDTIQYNVMMYNTGYKLQSFLYIMYKSRTNDWPKNKDTIQYNVMHNIILYCVFIFRPVDGP
jgi:preprotein translocase subunit SecE